MCFLKGLAYLFPPTQFIVHQWDLNFALTFFMASPFELTHRCTATQYTVFFVAMTSSYKVDERPALLVWPPFTAFYPDKLVLHTCPAFLLKDVSAMRMRQCVTLPSFVPPPHSTKEEEQVHRLDPHMCRALLY